MNTSTQVRREPERAHRHLASPSADTDIHGETMKHITFTIVALWVCGALGVACNETPNAPPVQTPEGSDVTETVDSAEDAISEVVPATPDAQMDGSPEATDDSDEPASCESLCSVWAQCAQGASTACIEACEGSDDLSQCEWGCIHSAETCADVEACLGIDGAETATITPGPYGIQTRDLAGPFQLNTLGGVFDFEDAWSGQDSFIFIASQTNWSPGEEVWNSQIYSWLTLSPTNVHYFFLAYPEPETGANMATEKVSELKGRVDEALEKVELVFGKPQVCHWRRHIHYVTELATTLPNWIGQRLSSDNRGFAIDRFQRLRNLGMLYPMGGTGQLSHLNFEAQYYNFEWEREAALWKEDVTEVSLYSNIATGGSTQDVELPDAEAMSGFDTLEIDLTSFCPDHDEGQCPAWDYLAHLWVKEYPEPPDGDPGSTPCTPSGDDTPAETLTCTCIVPGGTTRESTQTCRDDGTGFNPCSCDQRWEVARWITTYWREGRWVSDASPWLALLKAGGNHRFQYQAGNTYITEMTLRFFNQGKGERPSSMLPLFTGGTYNATYNDKYSPLTVQIPDTASRAEVVALITGHGFGKDTENCAEFCNHSHHFTVGDYVISHDHSWVGQNYGCAYQVPMGTVPNQFGTWTFGRGGWCPGKDVIPFIGDISDHVTPGQDATISYHSLLGNAPYDPVFSDSGSGFQANINMQSWLVFYE